MKTRLMATDLAILLVYKHMYYKLSNAPISTCKNICQLGPSLIDGPDGGVAVLSPGYATAVKRR